MLREASAASVRELCSAGMGGLESSRCYAVTRGSLGSRGGLTLKESLFWGHHVSKHLKELVRCFLMSCLRVYYKSMRWGDTQK